MPSQRPFFLSSLMAAFRQQPPSALSTAQVQVQVQQSNKHHTTTTHVTTTTTGGGPASSMTASTAAAAASTTAAAAAAQQLHPRHPHPHHHHAMPIPQPPAARRRGSDSSSEGFRDVIGADRLYIGGRTAAGEDRFFRLGVVRRVRSGDRLSLDRLSL